MAGDSDEGWRLLPATETVVEDTESDHEEDRRWLFEDAQRVIEPELEYLDSEDESEELEHRGHAQAEEEPPSQFHDDGIACTQRPPTHKLAANIPRSRPAASNTNNQTHISCTQASQQSSLLRGKSPIPRSRPGRIGRPPQYIGRINSSQPNLNGASTSHDGGRRPIRPSGASDEVPTSPCSQFGVNLGPALAHCRDVPTPNAPHSKRAHRGRGTSNVRWTPAQLDAAMDAVDAGTKIMTASHDFGIPCSTLRNHLFGTTISRKRGKPGVLTPREEGELVIYIKKMASLGYPLTLPQLRLKVAEMTQERPTPWSGGVPGWSWMKWFRIRHPDLSLRVAQGLETSRAKGLCPENVNGFYKNLEDAYALVKFDSHRIWNCDDSGAQAGKNGGARVLSAKGARQVHQQVPDEREHLSILSCINANGDHIPNFYIFKGKQFRRNYIKGCESGACMAMQPSAWMTAFLFDKWIDHFIACVQKMGGNMSLENRHLLIMDGHASHVTIDVVHKAKAVGLDVITLPSHTSHALQPLDVSCFKSFKAAFRACRDSWTLTHRGVGARKEDLASWVARGLKKALTPENIKKCFKAMGIWPLNKSAMDNKMAPSEAFVHVEGEEVVGIGEVEDIIVDMNESSSCHYFVEEEGQSNEHIVNPVISEEERGSAITHFLTLPRHFPSTTRRETTTTPTIDYSRSWLMTSDEYMPAMVEKARRKEEAENERNRKKEEMEANKRKRQGEKMQHEADKRVRAEMRVSKKKFDELWFVKNCAAIGEALHKKIKEGASIIGYSGRFCGFMPPLCKHNMKIAMEKRRMRKLGLSVNGYTLMELPWGYKVDTRNTPTIFRICSMVVE